MANERAASAGYGEPTAVAAPTADVVVGGINVTQRVAEIDRRGYTVIPDFLDAATMARIRHAFDTEVPITEMRGIGVTSGKSLRAHNLLGKTRAVDGVFLDPRLRALVEGLIGPRVQVNITTLFDLLPGETRQFLHQDDGLWPIKRPHPHLLCNALIALDDFDRENGATHLVPYSHRWVGAPDQSVDTVQVTMRAGSMLMWAGALWHAGGANITTNRRRLGLFMSHAVAWLRPQEIQLLGVPAEVARQLPEELLRLIGYHRFGVGVDGRDPIDVLRDGSVVSPDARIGRFAD